MALIVSREENVAITEDVAVEIVPTRVGRKSVSFELVHPAQGRLWVKLSGAAARDDGFQLLAGNVVSLSILAPGQGNSADFYEGPVSVLWEGGGIDPATNTKRTTGNVRVIEIS